MRQFVINGESMVSIFGPQGSAISAGSQLGLTTNAIAVALHIVSKPLIVDAYGQDNPVDEQVFGGAATITMDLIHFNPAALAECVRLSFPSASTEGLEGRAGTRRGGAIATGSAGNNFITLNIASPVQGLYWSFPTVYLKDDPYHFPLGTEKSVVRLIWRALAYSTDPWNGGTGSMNVPLYTRSNITIAADQP